MITKDQIMIKKYLFLIILVLFAGNLNAETKTYKMVFVPASEKGDESDYTSLIAITEKLTGFNIDTIKVTDYNAAVEAMRAGRAHIAWYGGKTYVKAAEIANAEAFAAVPAACRSRGGAVGVAACAGVKRPPRTTRTTLFSPHPPTATLRLAIASRGGQSCRRQGARFLRASL